MFLCYQNLCLWSEVCTEMRFGGPRRSPVNAVNISSARARPAFAAGGCRVYEVRGTHNHFLHTTIGSLKSQRLLFFSIIQFTVTSLSHTGIHPLPVNGFLWLIGVLSAQGIKDRAWTYWTFSITPLSFLGIPIDSRSQTKATGTHLFFSFLWASSLYF